MDEQAPDTDYIKGFNEGNLIAQHMPDLADKIASAMTDSSRGMGFKDGRQEFTLQQKREKYPSWRKMDWMDQTKAGPKEEKLKDLDKDIDDPAPEIS